MPEHTSQPMTEDQENLRDRLLSDGKATPDGEDQPWPEGVPTPDEVMKLAEQARSLPPHSLRARGSSTPEQLAASFDRETDRLASATSMPWGPPPEQSEYGLDMAKAFAQTQLAAEPTTQLLESAPVPVLTAPPNAYGTLFAVNFSGNRVGHLELPIIGWDSSNQALFIESSTGNLVTAETVCGKLLDEQHEAESVEVVTAGPLVPPPAKVPGQPARTQGGLVLPGQ